MQNHTQLQIVGIDAAVDPRNTGVAIARFSSDRWQVLHLENGRLDEPLSDSICTLLDPAEPVLLAIDAPLGWPIDLINALRGHKAGEGLEGDSLFNRATDRFVREKTGLKPLDIGADRIARTAVAALTLVATLRQQLGQALPLLASPEIESHGGLIEVYPAATLKQRSLPFRQYKKPEASKIRTQIAAAVAEELDIERVTSQCVDSDHCLDAVLCVYAAIDFLAGRCVGPTEIVDFRKEGWIWFAGT